MSFSDLMSSGRGPGVIGMVLALIVLLGFGLLFTFATDDSLQGADLSIEAIIRRQEKEIETYEAIRADGTEKLAKVPSLLSAAKTLDQVRREILANDTQIESLKTGVATSASALAEVRKSFEGYKDEYRNLVRSKAKGELIARLETSSGVVYNNVNLREVTPVGIQIRHDGGQKRIGFEELPAEMQERFQFDPNQKADALAQEIEARKAHEADVAASNERIDAELAKQKEQDAILAKKRAVETLKAKEIQLRNAEGELKKLERALVAEKEKKFSRAPAMAGQINAKREEVSMLRGLIAQLKANPQ